MFRESGARSNSNRRSQTRERLSANRSFVTILVSRESRLTVRFAPREAVAVKALGQSLAVGASVLVGLIGLLSCIRPGDEVLVEAPGFQWCGQAAGARAYDNQPVDGVPIMVPDLETPPSDDYPMDCSCFLPETDSKLQDWRDSMGSPPVPADPDFLEYAAAMDRIQDKVYEHCFNSWINEFGDYGQSSCTTASYSATMPIWRRSNVGQPTDCVVLIGPRDGYATTGMDLDPGDEITCSSQGHCTITSDYVEEVVNSIWIAANESAYGVFNNGLQLVAVSSNDVIYRLGLRSGDVLKSVNSQQVGNVAQVQSAMLSLASSSSFSVQVKRGTNTLTYSYVVN